jgi:predicted transcriptional regulator
MTLSEVIDGLSLERLTDLQDAEAEVSGGYCGDLLSHVLSKAQPGELWVTIQHHANVIAVAQVAGLSGVIIADGKRPDDAMLARAREQGVVLLSTSRSTFEIAGQLHRLLSDSR